MENRHHFTQELQDTQAEAIRLGRTVVTALEQSLAALRQADTALAQQVITADAAVDAAYQKLEQQLQILLATQQPIVASDLRQVRTLTAIASELERMGDYAKGIARRTQILGTLPEVVPTPPALWQLGDIAQRMARTSMDALDTHDAALAETLAAIDSTADELEDTVRLAIFQSIREQPQLLESGVALLEISHALERFADRTTNIGERVIFMVYALRTNLNA